MDPYLHSFYDKLPRSIPDAFTNIPFFKRAEVSFPRDSVQYVTQYWGEIDRVIRAVLREHSSMRPDEALIREFVSNTVLDVYVDRGTHTIKGAVWVKRSKKGVAVYVGDRRGVYARRYITYRRWRDFLDSTVSWIRTNFAVNSSGGMGVRFMCVSFSKGDKGVADVRVFIMKRFMRAFGSFLRELFRKRVEDEKYVSGRGMECVVYVRGGAVRFTTIV